MKIRAALLIVSAFAAAALVTGCGRSSADSDTLYVYNWGEYIDPDVITQFEEETGISVVYDVFETNEVMYPKVASDPSQYDVICPSDYMIEKMHDEEIGRAHV